MSARVLIAVLLTSVICLVAAARGTPGEPQGGDQFLDGIGETGLVARYVLNANAEDTSRNQFHAALRGNGGTFVDDEQFRRALLLTGDAPSPSGNQTLAGKSRPTRRRRRSFRRSRAIGRSIGAAP